MKALLTAIILSLVFVGAACADVQPSYTDLWDVSTGATVSGSSRILWHGYNYYSDASNMFGANGGTIEVGNTVFEDWIYDQGSQWIGWHTVSPVTVGSFTLFATDYGQARSFSSFQLYAIDFQTPIHTFTPTESFGGVYSATIDPVTAQDFMAVFGWGAVGGDWDRSARIMELDGFAPQQTVPEPATMSLLGLGIAGLFLRRKKRG